ncbi:unnamed protein product [Lepeophtheirus salmonis]|nr:unnamed protein product [Lepeophtheirus salmonis]CAF2904473.1 unnamed protein product [Lepeophtheirus salmonis]
MDSNEVKEAFEANPKTFMSDFVEGKPVSRSTVFRAIKKEASSNEMVETGNKGYKSCQRLVDYICIVGTQYECPINTSERERVFGNNGGGVSVENPFLMRRFPDEDHSDFKLPLNIVSFCQPEGCIIVGPKKTPVRDSNSFVFTLTDKDSGITRYGICLNFYRPILKNLKSIRGSSNPSSCLGTENNPGGSAEERSSDSAFSSDYRSSAHVAQSDSDNGHSRKKQKSQSRNSVSNSRRIHSHRRHRKKRKGGTEEEDPSIPSTPIPHHHSTTSNDPLTKTNGNRRREKAGKFYALTSLCLVSHYPFFANFRECLHSLKYLIDATGSSLLAHSPRRRGFGGTGGGCSNVGSLSLVTSKKKSKHERSCSIWKRRKPGCLI